MAFETQGTTETAPEQLSNAETQTEKQANPEDSADNHENEDVEEVAVNDESKDPRLPANWTESQKQLVAWTACSVTLLVGLNATAEATAALSVNQAFDISDAVFPNSYWAITSWNVGAALAPLVLLSLMENFGLRYIYLACYFLFILFLVPQAVATSYATLIVSRFFAGAFGSTVQNAVANISGDLWENDSERSFVITIFVLIYLVGFTLGPVYGGAIISGLSWRWIFYLQIIICGIHFPIVCLLMKETRTHIILSKQAKQLEKETGRLTRVGSQTPPPIKSLLYEATVRSLYLFVTEPVLFTFTIWSALAIGNVFLATQSIAQIYTTNYGFTAAQVGLVQASMVIGEFFGGATCIWQNRIYETSRKRNPVRPGEPIIEWRLVSSIPASFLGLSGGLFWYAWSSTPDVHWVMPTIGLGIVGFGIVVVVQGVATYIVDAYANYAGSAVATLAFLEYMFSGFLPLAAQKMYTKLGFQWASSVLAFAALLLSFAPVVLMWKGRAIRQRSKFMRNY